VTIANDDYGRRTLEFIEQLQRLETAEEICGLIAAELARYGLTFITSFRLPGPGDPPEQAIDLNTRPADYIEHYVSQNYVDRDPLVRELRWSVLPFTWDDVRNTRQLSKAERSIIDEGRDFGANNGMVIPIVSATGSVGLFCPCGREPDLSQRARSALDVIGVYSYHALRRLAAQGRREQRPKSAPLTPREREIMKWVATGKTDDEIADILTIGRETVTTHVDNAKRKLNATRRTYAVVQALRFGEISL
jgi:LuxR family transcriptional regulator, quorum-sensing system regulator BjaR1